MVSEIDSEPRLVVIPEAKDERVYQVDGTAIPLVITGWWALCRTCNGQLDDAEIDQLDKMAVGSHMVLGVGDCAGFIVRRVA